VSAWTQWLWAHLATVVAVMLVVPFLARILRERRPQGSTLAWMLVVIAVPYVGIPLYLVLGPRKVARGGGKQLYSGREETQSAVEPDVARLLCADGIRLPRPGTDVTLLRSGEAAFEALLALIGSAKRSIRISTFILGGDATGDAIVAKLTERAASGVEVELLLDGLFVFRAHRARLAELRRAGGKVATFAPMIHLPFRGSDNLRNHRKSAIFDDEAAIVGGMNLAEEYMGPAPLASRWCDLCALVRGPAVVDIAEVFVADWAFATGERLDRGRASERRGDALVQVVPSGPDSARDSFYEAILSACYAAKRRVWIATPYFVPDDALTRALSAASRRGVDVRVLVPLRSNHRVADLAGGASLRWVERAGGRVATFPRMLHAKAVVIDDGIGVVGSANFDMRSLFLDYELSMFLYSEREVSALAEWFVETDRACGSLPEATALRTLGEDIGRLLAPLV
jgi:cardiolipin synthase